MPRTVITTRHQVYREITFTPEEIASMLLARCNLPKETDVYFDMSDHGLLRVARITVCDANDLKQEEA